MNLAPHRGSRAPNSRPNRAIGAPPPSGAGPGVSEVTKSVNGMKKSVKRPTADD
jgi:hypothetical protein